MVKEKEVSEKWEVRLVITDESKPPIKTLVMGEETLDEWAYRAKLLNDLEVIKKALLS